MLNLNEKGLENMGTNPVSSIKGLKVMSKTDFLKHPIIVKKFLVDYLNDCLEIGFVKKSKFFGFTSPRKETLGNTG